jgi:hypothetical protein
LKCACIAACCGPPNETLDRNGDVGAAVLVVAVEGEKKVEVFAVGVLIDGAVDDAKNDEVVAAKAGVDGVDGVDTGFDEKEKAVGVVEVADVVVALIGAAVVGVAALVVVAAPKEKVPVAFGVAGLNVDVDVDVGGVAGGLKTVFLPHVT